MIIVLATAFLLIWELGSFQQTQQQPKWKPWDNMNGIRIIVGRACKDTGREFPAMTFNDSLVFDDGEHRVELIKMGPAHTSGDGIAYLPKEKILATGDLF